MSKLQDYLYEKITTFHKHVIRGKIYPFLKKFWMSVNQGNKDKIPWTILLFGIFLWGLFVLFLGWIALRPAQHMPMGGWAYLVIFGVILVFIHLLTNISSICTKNKNYALITNCGTSLLILYEYIKMYSYYIYDSSRIRKYITDEAYYSYFIWLSCYIVVLLLEIYVIKKRSAQGSLFVLILLLLLVFLGI